MKLVVFGLTISSSWGNGHATLWRGLVGALAKRGWTVVFCEKDVPYYAMNRDLWEIPGGDLILYDDFEDFRGVFRSHLEDADVAMVTSYCPDGLAASDLVLEAARPLKVFYDLDTPVTLSRLGDGGAASYVGPRGFRDFDLVLSYTGGPALQALRDRLGARRAVPLYGHVDPGQYRPAGRDPVFAGDLSFIGTYAADRQDRLTALLIEPAQRRPDLRFVIAGAQYPADFPWTDNIYFLRHLAPEAHPAFYASSRLTLNVTRRAMAQSGWCPSGRLFEAAASGAAILTDWWDGLDAFFAPGREILVGHDTGDALAALAMSDAELRRIAEAARARVLAEHTSDARAADFERAVAEARHPLPARRPQTEEA
ncbi:CgeB family protein [Prosthecomicrobium sp. N25]|uniref:CgeB family protein n=1 Tax=Prosthecomicrobium sp. N25 TaxID=3129254 RepID=UPI0030788EEA